MAKAAKALKVGDQFLLDGKALVVASLGGGRVVLEDKKNPDAGHVTLALAEVEWDEDGGAWSLPGRAGASQRSATATLRRGPAPKEK